MFPKTRKGRRPVSIATRRELSEFFGGTCILTGLSKPTPHHLNGDPSDSQFANLLPLNLELHNGLQIGVSPDNLDARLQESRLKSAAESHFRLGESNRAYGCLRLVYALSAHYFNKSKRDIDSEMQAAAHCFYFLRRSITEHRSGLGYTILEYLLSHEIPRTLEGRTIIPPYGKFCLLVELASWLCESGPPGSGLDFLRKAQKQLKEFRKHLRASDLSRFERQMANTLLQMNEDSREFETAVRVSSDCGDNSENNRLSVDNVHLLRHLSKNEPKKALDVLGERFEHFEKQTSFCFGPLDAMDSTVMTNLGYMGFSLIAESQLVKSSGQRRKLEARLRALKYQEARYARRTTLNRVPGLYTAAAEAAKRFPAMAGFLDVRYYPLLPLSLSALMIKTAGQLYLR